MAKETRTYDRLFSVERVGPDGIELRLALQFTWSAREQAEWPVLSWRTRLRPGGPNRRFYVLEGRPWDTTADILLDMLEQIDADGGLGEAYLDPRPREFTHALTSSQLADGDRQRTFDEITLPDEQWGPDPTWLALEERPHSAARQSGRWRKVLIVDGTSRRATIRSTTTDFSYSPRKRLRPEVAWALDNSMPDLNVQQARLMLAHLRQLRAA